MSLKFVPMGSINIISASVQIMAWHHPGYKPLSEPMMVIFFLPQPVLTREKCCSCYHFMVPYGISRPQEVTQAHILCFCYNLCPFRSSIYQYCQSYFTGTGSMIWCKIWPTHNLLIWDILVWTQHKGTFCDYSCVQIMWKLGTHIRHNRFIAALAYWLWRQW